MVVNQRFRCLKNIWLTVVELLICVMQWIGILEQQRLMQELPLIKQMLYHQPQVSRPKAADQKMGTCSRCGAPVAQMERVIPATTQLRHSLSRLESANRNKNLINSPRLAHLFANFKSALDGANAEVKKEQYAAKDELRAAMDRVIREM